MDGEGSSNAVAGPSTLPDAIPSYLPPAGPSRPSPYFKSTEDLLSKFQLLSAYDSYVRPFLPPEDAPSDKGKGKQRDMSPSHDLHPANINDLDDDELDRRKKKNSYKHLIKGIPGKHSTKKDDFLTTIMQIPPKQCTNIVPFDPATQRDAFSVGLDGLKGWNVNTLVSETPQAREDRRRKKELKKLAKSHTSGSHPLLMPTTPTQTDRVPGLPTNPKPVSSAFSRPPIPNQTTASGTPPEHTPSEFSQKRGKKRELEESITTVTPQQNHRQATPPITMVNGANGIRPRPVKKQRVDMPGQTQTRELPFQQQPTPQGV